MRSDRRETVRVLNNPTLGLRYLNRGYHSIKERAGLLPEPIDFLTEDWDNLLIFDGCRYDIFNQVCELPGTTETKISMCANTEEFLSRNLDGRSDSEIVLVTANSQVAAKDISVSFHEVIDVWKSEWEDGVGVPPESLSERVIEINEQFPNKRLIIHYIQPHLSFLTEFGKKIQEKQKQASESEESLWQSLRRGSVDIEYKDLRRAYIENLERVIYASSGVISELDGKTVITADHGQLLGERIGPIPTTEFGHPPKLYDKQIIKVPWHIVPFESRKTITEGTATPYQDTTEEEQMRKKLRQLGYVK